MPYFYDTESLEFLGKACQINIFPLVYASLHNHSECEELCIYSLSVIDHLCAHPPLLKHGEIRMESILRFMYTAFQQHGGNIQYQEAFTRCLARLLEVNDGLYMFVEDGNGNVDEGTPQLRYIIRLFILFEFKCRKCCRVFFFYLKC